MESTTEKDLRCIKRVRARLERWELPHLRELAASLHAQLEDAVERAQYAESCATAAEHRADMFAELAGELQKTLAATGDVPQIGLTQQGQLVVLQGGAA